MNESVYSLVCQPGNLNWALALADSISRVSEYNDASPDSVRETIPAPKEEVIE